MAAQETFRGQAITAAQSGKAEPARQLAVSALPAALSQSKIVARAACVLVAEAGADSATASVIKQF